MPLVALATPVGDNRWYAFDAGFIMADRMRQLALSLDESGLKYAPGDSAECWRDFG
jgi:hypothetical protein